MDDKEKIRKLLLEIKVVKKKLKEYETQSSYSVINPYENITYMREGLGDTGECPMKKNNKINWGGKRECVLR